MTSGSRGESAFEVRTTHAAQDVVDFALVTASAFGHATELPAGFDSDWHAHDDHHQVLFSARGALQLEVRDAQWWLPPQRAAWIAAGEVHRVMCAQASSLRTVYVSPSLVDAAPERVCVVFHVTALAREMLLHAMRWGPQRARDETADRFFLALAALCRDWTREVRPWRLPRARSEALARAMRYALDHLDEPPRLAQAARAAGLSTRSLTRRFREETAMTWRQFVHDARMLRAMALLAQPDARVTEAALAVGFESLSAFSRAFHAFVGVSPRGYLQTLRVADSDPQEKRAS